MRVLNRKRVGLPADPWSRLHFDTADHRRVAHTAAAAAEAQLMVSIVGPRGAGKTHSARRALRDASARVVEPQRLDREKLHMGDIQWALVRELSDERPKRSGEARSHQVRTVVGRRSQHGRVVLLIDDAHTLHHQTLRALKRLRELSWLGVSPLLGIVLLGQADRVGAIPEVGLRSDRVRLAGLSATEAAHALKAALGPHRAEGGAVAALSASERARNWLDLIALVDDCLAEAAARAEDAITVQGAQAVLHPGSRTAPDFEAAAPADDAVDAALAELDDVAPLRRAG